MIMPLGLMPSDELGPDYECLPQCPGYGVVYHVPAAGWTHEKCGTTGIFGAHSCPAEHNHCLTDAAIGVNWKLAGIAEEFQLYP